MHQPDEAALARAHRECARLLRSASESIRDTTVHIEDSKKAVMRSLDLLRQAPTEE